MAKQLWNMDLTNPLGIKTKTDEDERKKKQQAEKPQFAYAHNTPEKANNTTEIQMPKAVSDDSPYKIPFNIAATSSSPAIYGTKSGNKPTGNDSFKYPVYGGVTNRETTGVSNYNDRYWGRNIREAQKRERDEYNRLSELVKTPQWKMMTPAQQETERAKLQGAREEVVNAKKQYVSDEEHRADFKLQQAWEAKDMQGNVLPNAGEIRGEYIRNGQNNPNNPRNDFDENGNRKKWVYFGLDGDMGMRWHELTDAEKEYVDFLYGFYSSDIDTAESKVKALFNEKDRKLLQDKSKESGFVRNVVAPGTNVLTNLVAAPVYMGEVLTQGAKNVVSGLPRNMSKDTIGTQMMKTADASREAFVNGNAVKGLALDTVNSVTPAMFGAAAPVVYGMQSGGRSAYDAIQKGSSVGQAGTSAVMNATVSGIISKVGFDKLFEGGNLARNALKGELKKDLAKALGVYTLQQGGAEALEEGVESYADTIIDVLVNGDNSDMARLYNMHINNGHTPEQAQRMTLTTKLLTEPGISAALGGLMGMVMGDVNVASGTVRAYPDYKNTPGSVSVSVGGVNIRKGMSDAEVLELVRNGTQTGTNADMQYKIMESKENGKVAFLDGKRIGKRNDETRSQAIRRVFNENFKNKPVTVDETKDNVGMDQIGKYIYPGTRGENYNQKISALPILDEMIQIGSAKRWSENLLDKSGKVKKHAGYDCSNGFNYYDTKFTIDNSGIIYGGTIIVRLDKNGNAYFYDLDNVREVGYQDENEFYPAISLSTSLTENSIPQSKIGVNDFQNKVMSDGNPSTAQARFPSLFQREAMELKSRSEFASDEAYAHYLNEMAQNEFTKVPETMLALLDGISQRSGIKFVIGNTGYITGVQSAGAYSWKDDAVVLDYDTLQSPEKIWRSVINHELVHTTETSMFYKSLEKHAFEQMFGGNEKALNDAIKKKQERYARSGVPLGETRAKAELVASYIGESILMSEKAINRLVTEKPTLAMQIKHALIKTYFKTKMYFTDKEAYEAKYVMSDLEKGIKLFEKALDTRRNLKDFAQRLSGNVSGDVKYDIRVDKNGNKYWNIETEKDIFKGVTKPWTIKQKAYDYLIGKRDNNETVNDVVDGNEIQFIRLSAEEFTNSKESQEMFGSFSHNDRRFNQKMRMGPSIQDLIDYSNVYWDSPDMKEHKLFSEKGFRNYRGKVGIDDVIFNYVVRVGKTKFGKVFYDINLEVDSYLPHNGNVASDIKKESTSDKMIAQTKPSVNTTMKEALEKAGLNDFEFASPAPAKTEYERSIALDESLEEYAKRLKAKRFPDEEIERILNQINYGMRYALEGDYSVIQEILPGVSLKAVEKSALTGDISYIFPKSNGGENIGKTNRKSYGVSESDFQFAKHVDSSGLKSDTEDDIIETKEFMAYAEELPMKKIKAKHFPSYKGTGSDSHEQAVRWAHSEGVASGARKYASHNKAWYLIEKFESLTDKYQIVGKVNTKEFEKMINEVKNRERTKRSTAQGTINGYVNSNTTGDKLAGGGRSIGIDAVKHS